MKWVDSPFISLVVVVTEAWISLSLFTLETRAAYLPGECMYVIWLIGIWYINLDPIAASLHLKDFIPSPISTSMSVYLRSKY